MEADRLWLGGIHIGGGVLYEMLYSANILFKNEELRTFSGKSIQKIHHWQTNTIRNAEGSYL